MWQIVQMRDGRVVNTAGLSFPTKSSALGYLCRNCRRYRGADGWVVVNSETSETSGLVLAI